MSKFDAKKSNFSTNTNEFNSRYKRIDAIAQTEKSKKQTEDNRAKKLEIEGNKKFQKDGLIYRMFNFSNMIDFPIELLKTDEDEKSFMYGYINMANTQLDLLASNANNKNGNSHIPESISTIIKNIISIGKTTPSSEGKKYSTREILFMRSIKSSIDPTLPSSADELKIAIENRTKNTNKLLYEIGRYDAINGITIPSGKYPSITKNESYMMGINSILEETKPKHK